MKHYTQNTLHDLLKHPDTTVQRHAKGIEARLHALELEKLEYIPDGTHCRACGQHIYADRDPVDNGMCKPCFEFYNK